MTALVELKDVAKSFKSSDGTPRSVLERVDFTLKEGEIVALLGQSGSGKSTLLRIMAGLIGVDGGDVRYRGQPLFGPAAGIAMVFQSFALFPWLTVQKNVELGLEARGVDPEEREKRAEAAIELIGLAGFEGALPRELSGGMRQRVGLARALVTEPAVLLMDEAFSALDVLTGERLRNEILELWASGEMPTKAMLVVSHNIEEAVMMADRVLIFSSNPGRVRAELPISLPRPRDPDSLEVRALIDEVYSLMTAGTAAVAGAAEPVKPHLSDRLPEADVGSMESLLELLVSDFNGHADLPKIADESELTDEELLPLSDALHRLGLAKLERGDLVITGLGQRYVEGEHEFRRQLFGQQVLEHVPLIAYVRHSLEQESSGQLKEEPFLKLLQESMESQEAERVLKVAIEWARHGEVFEYDYNTGLIHLPEQDEI
ncbi:MAG TPA: nitrate/sulfonate/bicarbonate ABC transporter ATP-binding protein [Burkholderiaceae bacterium]|jgi:NitT/TauT family transport system ATP-binding protein